MVAGRKARGPSVMRGQAPWPASSGRVWGHPPATMSPLPAHRGTLPAAECRLARPTLWQDPPPRNTGTRDSRAVRWSSESTLAGCRCARRPGIVKTADRRTARNGADGRLPNSSKTVRVSTSSAPRSCERTTHHLYWRHQSLLRKEVQSPRRGAVAVGTHRSSQDRPFCAKVSPEWI